MDIFANMTPLMIFLVKFIHGDPMLFFPNFGEIVLPLSKNYDL